MSALLFKNPLLPAPAADPWILRHEGIWFSLQAVERSLQLRAAANLWELGETEPVIIWQAPQNGPFSHDLWAPEMHWLDGRWFLYLAADDGSNENHRMWVLEAETNNPFGIWRPQGMLETGGWAIDGTVLEADGRRYFVWSGWPGHANEQQNLYISEMRNPWELTGARVSLTEPTEPWERVALPLCEGPQILRHGRRTFVVYSASGSWTPDYCLGLLCNDDGKFMDPHSWCKRGPVFTRTDQVWGVGHCCFAKHPSAGDLMFYHAKTKRAPGWDDRNVRVQSFGWTSDGFPCFGTPVPV
jgi:GH43 family beta-xylosidase